MVMLRFLVTGGAGFIGSNLVEELLDLGEVSVIDDLSTGDIENIELLVDKGVSFIEASILDNEKLVDVSRGIDFIFHQAALPSVSRSIDDPVKSNLVNVSGTLNVLEAARKNHVKKVVYASSSAVYGDTVELPISESMKPNPLSPYAVSKLAAEYYCRVYSHIYGTPTVCLRYFNVFGPRQNPYSEYSAVIPKFISLILEGKAPTINGDGSITRDFVFVKDVVHANIQAIKTKAEGVFNIANGKQTSLKELAELIMYKVGTKVEIIYGSNRTGDVQDSFADITEAKDKLQYTPKYDIKKGLKETIKWYKMHAK